MTKIKDKSQVTYSPSYLGMAHQPAIPNYGIASPPSASSRMDSSKMMFNMILLSKTKSSKKKRKTDVDSDVSSPKKKSKYNKTSDISISIDPTRSVPPEEEMIKNNDNEVIKATSEVWLNGQKVSFEATTNQNPIENELQKDVAENETSDNAKNDTTITENESSNKNVLEEQGKTNE